MKGISEFLEKFTKIAQESDDIKNTIAEVLGRENIKNIDAKKIAVRGTIATLKLTALQKSEVFLKQKKIVSELAKNPLTKNITIVR